MHRARQFFMLFLNNVDDKSTLKISKLLKTTQKGEDVLQWQRHRKMTKAFYISKTIMESRLKWPRNSANNKVICFNSEKNYGIFANG